MRKIFNRKRLLLTVSGFSMLSAVPAYSQEEAAQSREGNSRFVLEDIVVTARKREENLQDTPISVVAVSGNMMEERGLSNISQIADFTPNLTFQSGASLGSNTSASIYIRGIGQSDFALTIDPGVGLYVDGVYMSRSVGGVLDAVDIERVEVLRGPQGTLFGKNTIGGAINVISQRPTDEISGYFEATGGSYDRADIKAAISLPLSDTFRTKLSVSRLQRDGFVKQNGLPFIDASNDVANQFLANGITNFSGVFQAEGDPDLGLLGTGLQLGNQNALITRFQADWDVSSNVIVKFDFDYTRKREQAAPRVLTDIKPIDTVNFSLNPFGNPLGWSAFAGYQYLLPGEVVAQSAAERAAGIFGVDIFDILPTTGDLKYVSDPSLRSSFQGATSPSQSDLDIWGIGATIDWDVSDQFNLKSITAYRSIKTIFSRDTDGSIFLINDSTTIYRSKQFSQEIQLSGVAVNDRLSWIIGGYFAKETGGDLNNLSLFPITIAAGGNINNNSYALFSQATYEITAALSLTAGLRWSQDKKNFNVKPNGISTQFVSSIIGIGLLPEPPAVGSVLSVLQDEASRTFSDLSPQVTLSYDISDDVMVYGSYSAGYKSGGFNQRLAPVFQTIPDFSEETVDVYEIGLKATGLDNRLRFNVSGFYSDYKDLQLTGIQNVSPIIENAAKATIYGFEAEVIVALTENIRIDGGLGYLSAKYDAFNDDIALDGGGTMTSARKRLEFSGITVDDMLPNAPDFSFNIGAELSVEAFGGEIIFRADISHRSKIALDAANFLVDDKLTLLHLSANYYPSDPTWRITVAARNVTNERYNVSGFADPAGIGIYSAQPARPSEWSLTVRKEF